MKALFALAFLALATPLAAAADDVTARLDAALVYPGEVARVTVEILESEDPVKAVDLAVPEGFTAEGPFGGTQKTSVVNGVRTSSVEVSFRVSPPGSAKGEYTVGPLRIRRASGKREEVPVGTLTVGDRPDQGVRMTVTPAVPSGPVGMPFLVTWRILYSGRPFENVDAFGRAANPYGLTSISIPVLKNPDVRVETLDEGSSDALRIGGDTSLGLIRGSQATADGVFQTLEFRLRITPLTTAEVDLSASAGFALVDRTERRRDFFGSVVEVPVGREFRAGTEPVSYRVESLPEEGRPRGFTGSVGRYSIEATAAPVEVNAFDPVQVTVTVRGEGLLDRVSLPRYPDFPEIAKDFEVDRDVDPGKMDGDAKVFVLTFRPRSSAVGALPGLPLPHYDPWKRAYEVATSAPVPLTVHDVKTVRTEDSVGPPASSAGAAAPDPISARLGIGANYAEMGATDGRLGPRPPLATPGFLLLLLAPPVLLAAAWAVARLRRRPRDRPKGTPLQLALADLGGASTPDAAAGAVAEFLRRRLELPDGEVSRREVERALAARVVPETLAASLLGAWDELEQARFAGGAGIPAGIGDILREVDACLG